MKEFLELPPTTLVIIAVITSEIISIDLDYAHLSSLSTFIEIIGYYTKSIANYKLFYEKKKSEQEIASLKDIIISLQNNFYQK